MSDEWHVIVHPTTEERIADGWELEGEAHWEIVLEEVCGAARKVTRRRLWKRVTVERTYEYLTRIE